MTTTDTPPTVNGTARPSPALTLVKELPVPTQPAPQLSPSPTKKARRTIRVTKTLAAAVRSEQARAGARFAVRHGAYILGGTRIVSRRVWEARSSARHDRMIRTAEAAGNQEITAEWDEKRRQFLADRHRRRMEMLTALRAAPTAFGAAALAGTGLLALTGIALAVNRHNVADVLLPFKFVLEIVSWAYLIATVVWGAAKLLGPGLVLLALWRVGQQKQAAPRWALPEQLRADGEVITPSIVVKAFRDLRIGDLKKAILAMEDGGASMLSPIKIAGCGIEVEVTLPSSVDTSEIEKKRRKLAENLNRHEHEVFILKSPQPRTVRLWIADSGALDEPIGPSPLVTDANLTADYKNGRAPWGQDLRGDLAAISLYQRHVLATGLSNQGKTAALRALALWLAHAANIEFRIADLKGIGDWRMFLGLATVLIEGPTDDHVIDATEMLEEGVAEMERRLMAPPGTTWKTLILIVDEAQLAFMCPAREEWINEKSEVKYGAPYGGTKATSRYFMAARKLHNQGRAVDVLLWQGTQDPTDQNLPKLVREGAHVRASLVVGTEAQAKMALGDKAVNGGAAPHLLRQGLDKGTLVVAGDGVELPPGEASITIRTHYIDTDEATEIAERIKRRRAEAGAGAEGKPLDHLANIGQVVGSGRMRTQDVLQRLTALNDAYRTWTFATLKAFLEPLGAEPYKTDGGVMKVSWSRVQEALDERARAAEEGEIE